MEPFKVVCIKANGWSCDDPHGDGWRTPKKGEICIVVDEHMHKGEKYYSLRNYRRVQSFNEKGFAPIDPTSELTKELAEKGMVVGDGIEILEAETIKN